MKKMKKVASFILAVIMLLSLAACGGDTSKEAEKEDAPKAEQAGSETADEIVIGCYQPLTGNNAMQGGGARNSVDLYVKELNARGGLLGKQVRVVHYDDASDPEEAVKAVTKLVESDKIDLCIGSIISGCVLASGELLNTSQIPTMGLGLSPTFMQQGWEYIIRPSLNTSFSIPVLTSTMKELGFESVAVFEGQDDYGVSAGKAMRAACEEAGITVTTTENYVTGDTDFSGQIAKILATEPDCVFMGVFSGDAGNVLKQLRQFGYDGIVFYSESLTQDIINVAGDAVDHVIFKYPYVTYDHADECTDEFMKEFLVKYEAEYGFLPQGEATYRGWDGMIVLEAAVNAAGTTDGPAVQKAMLELSGVKGLGGTFDFAAGEGSGEGLFDFASWVIVDGKPMDLAAWYDTDDYTAFAAQMGW